MTVYAAHEAAAAEEDALQEEARVRVHRIADSEQVAAGAAAETTSPRRTSRSRRCVDRDATTTSREPPTATGPSPAASARAGSRRPTR